ncbi:protein F37C4.5-like [Sycon ciliatum]|uniref:protein F37C4.5-like n=1 Tax=Sycon ciliatum TaxID=27933 RepID=UPI0031F62396
MTITTVEVDVAKCPVSEVVVYLDRADVTREVKVELSVGENEIVVKQLSSAVDSDSIRVEGRGCATIGEVKFQEKTVPKEEDAPNKDVTSASQTTTSELEKERDRLKQEGERLSALSKRLGRQQKFLDALMKKAGESENVTSATATSTHPTSVLDQLNEKGFRRVTAFMEFYSTQSHDLDEKVSAVNKEELKLRNQLKAVIDNLALRGVSKKAQTKPLTVKQRRVTINVTCEKASAVSLFLSYVVMEAGWQPQYDLRVFSKDRLLKIHYFALISQSTGEDWEDAALVLSTAQPSIGGSPPELETKKLEFARRVQERRYRTPASSRLAELQQQIDDVQQIAMEDMDMLVEQSELLDSLADTGLGFGDESSGRALAQLDVQTAEVGGTVTSTSFEIPRQTTIPADGTGHKVAVGIIDLQPEFEYETVPKQAAHAFLKAQVKNSSQYSLLQGPANVFMDNNFISKTSLDDVSPAEEFLCSLGVDPAIRVIYKPLKKFRETTGWLSKSNLLKLRQTVEVNNTRLEKIKIKLTDAIPRSSEETIKVNLVKPEVSTREPTKTVPGGSVTLTKENLLEWQLEVGASSKHVVEFAYNVESPASEADVIGW